MISYVQWIYKLFVYMQNPPCNDAEDEINAKQSVHYTNSKCI